MKQRVRRIAASLFYGGCMEIREYTQYREAEILPLYAAVGWTAYTQD